MTSTKKAAPTRAKDDFEGAAKTAQETYGKNVDQSLGLAKEQFEKAIAIFLKGIDEAQGQNRANLDAMIKANAIAAKGFEEMGRTWFGFAQTALDHSIAATKAMLGAKSLREVVDLQNDYAKTTFDSFLSEGSRLSEMGVKVANEAMAPIGERVNAAVETWSKPRAA